MKSYGDKINTNFQVKKVQKEKASHKCLSLIMLDSVVRVNKNYYPQTLLEECKYEIKKDKIENLINYDLDPFHLIMNLTMILTMIQIMNLAINLLMNLRIKTVILLD